MLSPYQRVYIPEPIDERRGAFCSGYAGSAVCHEADRQILWRLLNKQQIDIVWFIGLMLPRFEVGLQKGFGSLIRYNRICGSRSRFNDPQNALWGIRDLQKISWPSAAFKSFLKTSAKAAVVMVKRLNT